MLVASDALLPGFQRRHRQPALRSPLLGCIADDLTGATDAANALARAGLSVVQVVGAERHLARTPEAQAYVVALKSRTAPASVAVEESVRALAWLRRLDVRQFFFKYCSTFDSSDRGNIGPVADALLDALGSDFTIVCPAYPEAGRSVYLSHLFVDGALLSDSHMAQHPLTPMTDPSLVRVLSRQTPSRVGQIHYQDVKAGPATLRRTAESLRASGVRFALVDALDDENLRDIARAFADLPLLTGAAGLLAPLARLLSRGQSVAVGEPWRPPNGFRAVLAGSCAPTTREQVQEMRRRYPSLAIDPFELAEGDTALQRAITWAVSHVGRDPLLIYSSASPGVVQQARGVLGDAAATLIEDAFGVIARVLVAHGVRQMVVAGGETAGAVVQALGVQTLQVGPEIAPGVPWTCTVGDDPLALALKSGNFGSPKLFMDAWRVLDAS